MRKTYMQPTIKEVKINTAIVIAASPNVTFTTAGGTSSMESRRGRDFWDDEDE